MRQSSICQSLAFLLAACVSTPSLAANCFDTNIQRSIPEALTCTYERLDAWNGNLQDSYEMALSVARDWDKNGTSGNASAETAVKQSQTAWTQYSMHTCDMSALPYRSQDRQTADLIKYSCLEDHMKKRNEELRSIFEQN